MPAVLSERDFDARLQPLRKNLLLTAQKHVGPTCAEDVVQNATLSAWAKVKDFAPYQGQEQFAVWLQSHLHFEIQRYIVANARQQETTLPSSAVFALCDGPDAPHWEQDGWCEQRAELYRRLHNFALTPRQRDCCLRWIGGETLEAIAQAQSPPIHYSTVHYIIKRVGKLIADVDDADSHNAETAELIQNLPAALSYAGQMQRDARVRREANMYAMKQGRQREASRVLPRGKQSAKAVQTWGEAA